MRSQDQMNNSLKSTPDIAAHAGYMHARPTLLAHGVRLYEIRSDLGSPRGSGETRKFTRYGNYGLHAKMFVFDRHSLFVGSMNLDQRSVRLNTEMGLLIDSGSLAEEVADRFNKLTAPENAYEVRLASNAQTDPPADHGAEVPADRKPATPALVWKTRENGAEVEYHSEPARSAWQRIKVRLLALLPIDREL